MESNFFYILEIAILLLLANLGGIVSKKLNQPPVLGQIIVGIILGAGILEGSEYISRMGEIGVIFLMFIAGLETDVDELKQSSKSSSLIAIGGVLFPGALVFAGTYFMTKNISVSIFMAIISTATSVSISVQTLREIGKLRTKQGVTILGAAIMDDIMGIVLLTLAVGILKPGSGVSLPVVMLKIVGFFVITAFVGYVVIKLLKKFSRTINFDDKIVTYSIVLCMLLAYVSEELGVAAITGAYFMGVILSMTSHRHKISHEINSIATTMFTPIFFVSIGMNVDIRTAFGAIAIGSVIIVLGVIGKVIGSGLGAKLSGYDNTTALQIGIGMIPRAEVAIIIANLGVKMELIGNDELAAVILMVLVTTLITPSLLKWSFGRVKTTEYVPKASNH
ncbi:MAG: cation:proton antiporter [Acidaminobacteraceae bacterium]